MSEAILRGLERVRIRATAKSLFVLCALGVSGASIAADGPATGPGEVADLEEITVTAQKRAERLQDVPIAVTAVNSASLERFNITDVTGLGKVTPNVIIQPVSVAPTALAPFIRGYGERSEEPLNDMPIAISLDGVYLVGYSGAVLDTFDIAQVEVLRGPQGTLQGRNSVGGAINITSRRPTFEPSADFEVGGGNYGSYSVKARVAGAIIDSTLAAKVAVMTQGSDGYINDIATGGKLGSTESYVAKLGLLWTPNSASNIYLAIDLARSRPGQVGRSADDDKTYPRQETNPQVVSANCAIFNVCAPLPYWTTTATFTAKNLLQAGGFALNADFDLGPVTLTSVSGWRRSAEHQNIDLDMSSAPLWMVYNYTTEQNQASEELRLASNKGAFFGGALDWVVGGFFMHQHFDFNQPVFLNGLAAGIPSVSPDCLSFEKTFAFEPTACFLDLTTSRQQWLDSYAGFAHATWNFTPQLNAFGGVRYSDDRKNYHQENPATGLTPPGQAYMHSWNNLSADAGLQYKFSREQVAYVHFSQAYRAGGFNATSAAFAPDTYHPEKANSFEVGIKSQMFDGRLSFNADVFRTNYQDLQVVVVHLADDGVQESTESAGKAHIQGVELEGQAEPVRNLHLRLSVGGLDAKYDTYTDHLSGANGALGPAVDDSRLRFPYAPKWTFTAAADYQIHWGGPGIFGQSNVGLDDQYRTAYTTAPTDVPLAAQGGFGLLNAHIDLADASRKYILTFWMNNITDKHYLLNGELSGNVSHLQVEGLPRTYGAKFALAL